MSISLNNQSKASIIRNYCRNAGNMDKGAFQIVVFCHSRAGGNPV
jgi:hypothetical protein